MGELYDEVCGAPGARRNPMLRGLLDENLIWLPEAGVGYFECRPEGVYDQAYFDRYEQQAESDIGRRLMAARVALVKRHVGDVGFRSMAMIDVGIGSGAFIDAAAVEGARCNGFDVNPAGVGWLKERGLFRDLYNPGSWPIATFWDALEHIRDPRAALAAVHLWAFVAIPIFRDAEHVLASKHYRRDEHYWYFTRAGFRRFAEAQGFEVVDIVATETALGRDDIETFVLRRNG